MGQHGRHANREGSRKGLNPDSNHRSSLRRRRLPAAPSSALHLEPLPGIVGLDPADVAERLADLPGLALLETRRCGPADRWSWLSADPLAVVDRLGSGPDPFAALRALLGRMGPESVSAVPFTGGLVGYVGYDVARRLERLPSIAAADQDLPELHVALHDWVVVWDHRMARAWLAGRAVDGDQARLARRISDVRARLSPQPVADAAPAAAPATAARTTAARTTAAHPGWLEFESGLDRESFAAAVAAVRERIAEGDVYQVNIARRLQVGFAGHPWPIYRRLRTGDPARFAAYLALDSGHGEPDGGGHLAMSAGAGHEVRAVLSASPEPFLQVDAAGRVRADPVKGTRPRGRTRAEDRQLACDLLGSAKDRAENVMIVDVLRNDLGRVCRPGSVRVSRLCRLERTAAVQHLVSSITGRLRPGRDAFDLLASAFPGGSVTGAPKLRAMEIIEALEPVRRGPYTGAAGWIGPDGAMELSILIRTLVADGRRLTLHVGGGLTWRSSPELEWAETEAKARGPLSAIGAIESDGRADSA
jgi:para-aminobenzoate synthetase component 1